MKKLTSLFLLACCLSCANDPDPAADKAQFVKIYDNAKFSTTYFPIDIQQTADGGYLVLGGRSVKSSNLSGVYLMKVDEQGKFLSDVEVSDDYVNPVGHMLKINDTYYFFCMRSDNSQTQLISVDGSGTVLSTVNVNNSYPAVAALDNGNFLLQSYDRDNKLSVISVVEPGGTISKSKGYSIGAGDAVEEPIVNHFLRTGKQIPFQVGKTAGGQYYFNGFYNYTLALVFTDIASDNPSGVANGYQENGGFSQLLPLTGNTFAASRFNFGDNYILPKVDISTSGTSSITNLGGNLFPELVQYAPVQIIRTSIAGRDVLIYSSNTRSKQISLYFYDATTGAFLGSHYLGFSNPFEVTNLTVSADGGIAVCGTTYVAGRFARICLYKLSKETLSQSLKN